MEAVVRGAGDREAIEVFLRRVDDGVELIVKAAPEIEEYFKRWGGGEAHAPDQGRLWKSKEGVPMVWSYYIPVNGDNDDTFSLTSAGRELIMPESGRVNLSFLRLVDISKGTRITFETVMSRQELGRVAAKILKGAESFYSEYIRPVGMQVVVSVKEVKGGSPF